MLYIFVIKKVVDFESEEEYIYIESWPIRPSGAILQSLLGQDVVIQLLIQPGVTQDVAATALFSQVSDCIGWLYPTCFLCFTVMVIIA